ncbi:AAA family ATPase [Uliginosibacterium sp. 31-16]|uniref:AAA family ATPase n=1 Tax=Uliginosibacterium sp. 31-16 TaxID=3068315 RepID=UPI00273F1212|nr:AAA family ATPase [Uliginosibacterium sp. 31-16]MDP5241164.1 AAA family ATPase [Uliginosibacterium sp. 31-16]
MNDIDDLRTALSARFPILCIETHEEPRARALLHKLALEQGGGLYEWSIADGLIHTNFQYGSERRASWQTVEGWQPPREEASGQRRVVEQTQELQAALQHIDKAGEAGLYLLFDVHPFLEQAAVQRLLREIAFAHTDNPRTLVLIGPSIVLPPEIARHALFHTLRLPDAVRVRAIFTEEIELFAHSREGRKVQGEQAIADLLVQHLVGLCEEDVRRLLRLSIRDDAAITRSDIARIVQAKREMCAESALEIEFAVADLATVGGMPNLKRWLALRQMAFAGQAPNLPAPRGVLLLGVQGAGKSLAARTIAGAWNVPLARLDMGSLFDKFHGETERNLRKALAAAESLAPCVLWIDEIEKALAQGSAESDGGVGRRVLGTLLTWMSEHDERVFIAATANDIRALPPELMRKGRFDEIFFVDLPDAETRREILGIHLARRGHAATGFDLEQLARASEGFTGAEIEQAIVGAAFEAHASRQPLATGHIAGEMARTRPLSVLMAETMAELRSWAQARTVLA